MFHEDFETDPAGRWSFSHTGVFAEYVPRDWEWTADLPPGREGSALFADDDKWIGDCITGFGDQSRLLSAESPQFVLDAGATLTFEHYVATEHAVDGGNLKVSVNGGPYVPINPADFVFNPYNITLIPVSAVNGNPLGGQPAFSGTDGGEVSGSWGRSSVSLDAYAGAGDAVRLRLDFGADGCGGIDGWYLDDLFVCTSPVTAGTVPDGYRSPGQPLTVDKDDREVVLNWGDSCHAADADFEVYEGTLGDFSSHVRRFCSTSGETTSRFQPTSGDKYFLVVASNGSVEGSYGTDSEGIQRPTGVVSCRPQVIKESCGQIDVSPGNEPPVITSVPTLLADHNREWRYQLLVSDPDGDPIQIGVTRKPDWVEFDETTRVLSGTAGWDQVGTHQITIVAYDGTETDTQVFTLNVQKGEIVCNQPFGDPADSLYVLPWTPGLTYTVQNAHCPPNPTWGHQNTFAYDFNMQIGDPVLASRAGTVIIVREFNMDGNRTCGTGGENWIFVQHGDGTVMQYVHLTFNGSLVDVGDYVEQGQVIGLSGDTGCSSGPHLHTWLFRDATDFSRKASLPVNYRNASGVLDFNNALIIGGSYTALPFTPDHR